MNELTPLRRNRDFLLLQAGQLLSTFGAAMSAIAYPLLALALTGSAAKALPRATCADTVAPATNRSALTTAEHVIKRRTYHLFSKSGSKVQMTRVPPGVAN